jgi:hypothetical protein
MPQLGDNCRIVCGNSYVSLITTILYILFIYFMLVLLLRLPLWSSGQSSWLQIQRSEFDTRRYQIFCEVVGQEWGPLNLVSTIEELLERKSNDSGLENPKIRL